MGGEAIVGPALSGQFYAGTGKQYNFGSVSGEKIYMGTGGYIATPPTRTVG